MARKSNPPESIKDEKRLSEAQEGADKQPTISKRINGRPWPKGVSGNPKGRPKKGTAIADVINGIMNADPEIRTDLAKRILDKAINEGSESMLKLLWNYLDGMPVQRNELTGKDGDPIKYAVKDQNALTELADKSGIIRSASGDTEEEG